MRIVVISKNPFNIITYDNVTKVEFASNTYTIYVGTTTYTYSNATYIVRMI